METNKKKIHFTSKETNITFKPRLFFKAYKIFTNYVYFYLNEYAKCSTRSAHNLDLNSIGLLLEQINLNGSKNFVLKSKVIIPKNQTKQNQTIMDWIVRYKI